MLDLFLDNTGLELNMDPDQFPGEQNQLLLSDGSGMLQDVTATHLPQFVDFSHGSAAADIDGDNDIDIWVNNLGANGVRPYLMLNDGNGVFTVVADMGNEGDNGPNVGLNGRLPPEVADGIPPYWTVFIDVDNDMDADLFTGAIDRYGGVDNVVRRVILINDGTGVFSVSPVGAIPPAPAPFGEVALFSEVEIIDLNSDGIMDLILFLENVEDDFDRYVQILIGNGDGTYSDETNTRFPSQVAQSNGGEDIWMVDLDGDGDSDLLTASNTRIEFYENDGNGVFTLLAADAVPTDTFFIPIDVDADALGTDFINFRPDGQGGIETVLIKRDH